MDSVKCATSAAGPPANRPLRDTGEADFMLAKSRGMWWQNAAKSLRNTRNSRESQAAGEAK
jgi:hypothetical protein